MPTFEMSKILLSQCTTITLKHCRFAATSTAPALQTLDAATSQTSFGECPFHKSVQEPRIKAPVAKPKLKLKSYYDIPTPKSLPIIGTNWDFLTSGSTSRLHLYCHKRHEQFGPIYRETLGVVEAVFVSGSPLVHKIYESEGQYPQHLVPEAWKIYNENTDNKRGLFFMEGKPWLERRKTLNRVFFQTFDVEKNSRTFNNIVTDVIDRWKIVSRNKEIPELEKELYKWSIESLGVLIFGKRMGCLNERSAKHIQTFVNSTQHIFMESAKMTMIPPQLAYKFQLPVWRRFHKAVTTSLEIAQNLVEDAIKEIGSSEQDCDGIIVQLLKDGSIEKAELVRIVTDLVVAAADTTSHAVQWAMYLVAKHPEWQDKMLEEIQKVVPKGETLNGHHLQSMPLIRSVVKESLRLYPVAPLLTRILPQDLILGGYKIPAGKLLLMSLYTTGRDPKYFKDPESFNPGRWLNVGENGRHACLPFGLGVRACIGRRVAELQMQLLLGRTVETFKMEVANTNEVEIKLRMITTPSEKIRLRLTERV